MVIDGIEIASLDCNTMCSGEADTVVVWNIHLMSLNYDISLSCNNGSCVSRNNDTELLNLEQNFVMFNNTLQFEFDRLYQDALVGCIATADNCTANRYWTMYSFGMYSNACFAWYLRMYFVFMNGFI